jgi:hypothetical protein
MKIDIPAFKHCFIGGTSLLTAYKRYAVLYNSLAFNRLCVKDARKDAHILHTSISFWIILSKE